MPKKTFDSWRRESIDAEVEYNLPEKVIIYLAGPIAPKKNSRQNFWRISLPSQNYIERHKRIINKLKNTERRYNWKPCVISITSIVWDRIKSDCDNQVASIMDTIVDLGIIEDDNRFVVKEINVRNIGYAKNCWLHRVEITPYKLNDYDLLDDHKDKPLLEFKQYLDEYALRN